MKSTKSCIGSRLSPRASTLSRNSWPTSREKQPSLAKARERVRVEHLGPLVRVVAACVADRVAEQVAEAREHRVVVGQRRRRERRAAPCARSRARRRRAPGRTRMCSRRSTRRSRAGASSRWRRGRSARARMRVNSASGMRSPVCMWRANRSSASRSQHQFSMICEGSSTKSHATLVPARLRDLNAREQWWSRCPNSWKIVSTSRCDSSAGASPSGGVTLAQISPTCGVQPGASARRSRSPFIHAPPRFCSRGIQIGVEDAELRTVARRPIR